MSTPTAPARPGRNLEYPFDTRPVPGETIEIRPGIHWIRMRLPMQLNHINLWLLEDGDGWTIVDTGIRNDETTAAWEQLFSGAMGGRPIKRVIVTHMHPDHIGLAGWLCRRFKVELWISRTEYLSFANQLVQGPPTVYWYDRLENPTVTFWPVPDTGGPYTFDHFVFTQVQDANLASGETPDIPYRWLDALVAALAHRMARIFVPPLEQQRKQDAQEAWAIAADQDTENVNFVLAPTIRTYYRGF